MSVRNRLQGLGVTYLWFSVKGPIVLRTHPPVIPLPQNAECHLPGVCFLQEKQPLAFILSADCINLHSVGVLYDSVIHTNSRAMGKEMPHKTGTSFLDPGHF